jgi:hypothetical protein
MKIIAAGAVQYQRRSAFAHQTAATSEFSERAKGALGARLPFVSVRDRKRFQDAV